MSSSLSPTSTEADESQPGEDDPAEEQAVEAQPDGALPLDVTFDILKNARRRRVLRLLAEGDEPTTLGALAERIAAIENDKPRSQLDAQERKRVYVGLYQCHLPRMDDAGVVEFDGDRGSVELGPHAVELLEYLETATESDRPETGSRFPALCGIGGLLVGAAVVYSVPGVLPVVGTLVLVGAASLVAVERLAGG